MSACEHMHVCRWTQMFQTCLGSGMISVGVILMSRWYNRAVETWEVGWDGWDVGTAVWQWFCWRPILWPLTAPISSLFFNLVSIFEETHLVNFSSLKTGPHCFGIVDNITVLHSWWCPQSNQWALTMGLGLCPMFFMNYDKNSHGHPSIVPVTAPLL